MAEEKESPIIIKLRELMMGTPAMHDQSVNDLASNVDTSSDTVKNYAEGGPVMDPKMATGQLPGVPALPGMEMPSDEDKLKMAMDEMIAHPRPDIRTQEELEMSGEAGPNLAQGGIVEGPTDEDKLSSVMEALHGGKLNMADENAVDPSQLPLPADAPHEDKLGTIARMMGAAGNFLHSPVAKVAGFAADPVGGMADLVAPRVAPAMEAAKGLANPAISAMNTLTGQKIPSIPQAAPAPAPVAAQTPAPMASVAPTMPVEAPKMEQAAPAHMTDFNALFNQDPTKIAPGYQPQDRQKAAGDVWNQQHTIGGMIAEALTGLGDAFAAKGGVNQDMLGKLMTLQGDRRKEVMDNFDKAREIATQNFNLKSQMGKNAIDMLAAKDAHGPASPAIVKLLSGMGVAVPPGTLNKDLPMIFQAAKAKADQAVAHGEAYLKATKQASDEIEAANKEPGLLHARMGPEEQMKHIKYRTAEIMAQSQGMVHVRTSDGKEHFIPSANVDKAKQMDRGLKVLQ